MPGTGTTGFRLGLDARSIPYVLAVKASTSAYPFEAVPETVPAASGQGRPSAPRYRDNPSSLRDIALTAGRRQLGQVTWRRGTRTGPANKLASMTSRFLAIRIRPANRDIPLGADGSLSDEWLICEWPPGPPNRPTTGSRPCPPRHRSKPWSGSSKCAWRIEHDYRELKTGLGLAHFEDRSFTGWHRHATLVTAAHLFITGPAPPLKSQWGSLSLYGILKELQQLLAVFLGHCPTAPNEPQHNQVLLGRSRHCLFSGITPWYEPPADGTPAGSVRICVIALSQKVHGRLLPSGAGSRHCRKNTQPTKFRDVD